MSVIGLWSAGVQAAESAAAVPFKKPAWLTDCSVGVKEGYDDNVYLSGAEQSFLPAPLPTPPAGSVMALNNLPSWVTTISPKFGVDLAPVLGDRKQLQALTLAYTPDIAIYHQQTEESYQAHRFVFGLKEKQDAFSATVDNNFSYVHGSDIAPFYPGAFLSAYGIAAPRERREQIQDRATVNLRYDLGRWFVRPTAALLYYDLMTTLTNATGYQNFCDRYDVNGGLDVGYAIVPPVAATVGYRYGHQYQQQFTFSPYSSPSDYHRVLLGLEGTPWKWLTVKLQGGPDFRSYPDDTPTHITPVDERHPVTYYGEANLTATLSKRDKLTFKYKQFQWVSSTGKVPYFDSCYDLSYHRDQTKHWGLDLGAKILTADYNSGNLPACRRFDAQYSVSGALTYTFTSHLTVQAGYNLDIGRNLQGGIVNPQTREFMRNLYSVAASAKF